MRNVMQGRAIACSAASHVLPTARCVLDRSLDFDRSVRSRVKSLVEARAVNRMMCARGVDRMVLRFVLYGFSVRAMGYSLK